MKEQRLPAISITVCVSLIISCLQQRSSNFSQCGYIFSFHTVILELAYARAKGMSLLRTKTYIFGEPTKHSVAVIKNQPSI